MADKIEEHKPMPILPAGIYPSKILGFDEVRISTGSGTPYLPVRVLIFGERRTIYMLIQGWEWLKMVQASESFWINRPVQIKVRHFTRGEKVYCSLSFYKFEGVEADGEHKQASAEDIGTDSKG